MRTEFEARRAFLRVGSRLLVVAAAIVFVLQSTVSAALDTASPRLPKADVDRVGEDMVFGSQPESPAIGRAAALDIAAREYDPGLLGASSVDAYLETITMPGTLRSASPIKDRGVWIVRLGGLSQQVGGPLGDVGPAPLRTLTVAYIVVDATTGEFLLAEWLE